MIAYNALILTPHGYRYVYNLRRGARIWVFEHDRYVTQPLQFQVSPREHLFEVTTYQTHYSIWQGAEHQGGGSRGVFNIVDSEVMTKGGWRSVRDCRGAKIPRIPSRLLSSAEHRKNDHYEGQDAIDRLARNAKRGPVNDGKVEAIDAVGPVDSRVLFGGDFTIQKVRALGKSVATVTIGNPNVISNGLIIKGD